MIANKKSVSIEPKSSPVGVMEPVIASATASAIDLKSAESGEDTKIIRGLKTFVGVGLVVFGISAWNLFDIYRGFRSISEKNFRLQELSGVIIHLDEVLTMSARMQPQQVSHVGKSDISSTILSSRRRLMNRQRLPLTLIKTCLQKLMLPILN